MELGNILKKNSSLIWKRRNFKIYQRSMNHETVQVKVQKGLLLTTNHKLGAKEKDKLNIAEFSELYKTIQNCANFKNKKMFSGDLPIAINFTRYLLQSGVRGYVLDYHDTGCSAETEYTVAASFPWNKLPSVLPKFHLSITDVAFIVHNDRWVQVNSFFYFRGFCMKICVWTRQFFKLRKAEAL